MASFPLQGGASAHEDCPAQPSRDHAATRALSEQEVRSAWRALPSDQGPIVSSVPRLSAEDQFEEDHFYNATDRPLSHLDPADEGPEQLFPSKMVGFGVGGPGQKVKRLDRTHASEALAGFPIAREEQELIALYSDVFIQERPHPTGAPLHSGITRPSHLSLLQAVEQLEWQSGVGLMELVARIRAIVTTTGGGRIVGLDEFLGALQTRMDITEQSKVLSVPFMKQHRNDKRVFSTNGSSAPLNVAGVGPCLLDRDLFIRLEDAPSSSSASAPQRFTAECVRHDDASQQERLQAANFVRCPLLWRSKGEELPYGGAGEELVIAGQQRASGAELDRAKADARRRGPQRVEHVSTRQSSVSSSSAFVLSMPHCATNGDLRQWFEFPITETLHFKCTVGAHEVLFSDTFERGCLGSYVMLARQQRVSDWAESTRPFCEDISVNSCLPFCFQLHPPPQALPLVCCILRALRPPQQLGTRLRNLIFVP
jgi:hypothetical protein